MSIRIRIADEQDLDFVSQDRYVEREIVQRKLRQQEVFLAEVDGVPAGYLRLEFLWSIQPYVALIHVIEPFRRRGVGAAMLSHVENALRSAGHAALYSSSQVDEAEPQAWHRRMGFEECGVIHGVNSGGIGELFFRKEL